MDKKEVLDHILNDKLSLEQEKKLYDSPSFYTSQQKAWFQSKNSSEQLPFSKDAVFQQIANQILPVRSKPSSSRYWLSLAASLIIGVLLSSMFWILTPTSETLNTMYVWSNGKQHIETIILPDGTEVLLGPESSLTYPNQFNDSQRLVLLNGQGFFDVAKNDNMPFIVRTAQMDITALGTAFEVFSFKGDMQVETTLLNGKIKVSLPNSNTSDNREIYVCPNQKLSIKEDTYILEKIDADNYLSWRSNKKLTFVDQPLSVIIPRLERWYGIQIQCPKDIAKTYRFSFTVDTDSHSDVMKFISHVSELIVVEDNGSYLIKKNAGAR